MPGEDIEGVVIAQVYNLSGALVINEELQGLSADGFTLNTSFLEQGLYTLSVSTEKELIESREFLKQ